MAERTINWMALQLMRETAGKPRRFNPRPPGSIQPGGTPSLILEVLTATPGRWWSAQELIELTERVPSSVTWSLFILRQRGLIVGDIDHGRCSRYMRYTVEP